MTDSGHSINRSCRMQLIGKLPTEQIIRLPFVLAEMCGWTNSRAHYNYLSCDTVFVRLFSSLIRFIARTIAMNRVPDFIALLLFVGVVYRGLFWFELTNVRWCFNKMLSFRVRSIDVIAFFRNGVCGGVTAFTINVLSLAVESARWLKFRIAARRSRPLVVGVHGAVADIGIATTADADEWLGVAVTFKSLNHLVNIWRLVDNTKMCSDFR